MSPSEPVPLEVGSKLGPYRLMRLLGEGGMGMVFVAQHTILGHEVALKCMRPEYARRQPKARERFFREAKLAFSLRDTNRDRIVKVTHVDEVGDVPYLIMELLKGKSLHDYLIDHHIPDLSFTLKLAQHVGEGLSIAHRAGLIHRDIKPHNLWIEELPAGDWRCKILDFGLARAMEVDDGLTTTGAAVGTPAFTSPEQWSGRDVDHRTDLFSLGVVLFRLVAGECPFQAENAREFMFRICFDPPKQLLQLKPSTSPPLTALIHRLLEKDKEKRPLTAQALLDELNGIFRAPGTDIQLIPHVEAERKRGEWFEQPLDCTGPNGADEATVQRVQRNWSEALGLPVAMSVDLGEDVKMEFVLIPPGKFWMGSPDSEEMRDSNEGPLHVVTLTKPFYLGKYQVTQQEYLQLIGTNPSHFAKVARWRRHPVETVNWHAAAKFCELLTPRLMLCGLSRATLPTEAQWEYACRAGTRTPFHFGGVLNGDKANCDGRYPYGTTKKGKYLKMTCPVGVYTGNAFGLFDLHGNVWEWLLDAWEEKAYQAEGRIDPFVSNPDARHCLRGGSWRIKPWLCRSAGRYGFDASYDFYLYGFRVLLPLD